MDGSLAQALTALGGVDIASASSAECTEPLDHARRARGWIDAVEATIGSRMRELYETAGAAPAADQHIRCGGVSAAEGRRKERRRFAHRQGVVWHVLRGDLPEPAATVTLGWELIDVDPSAGTISVGFAAGEAFLNPAGAVRGGLVAAMLDDTLGPALVATLPPGQFAPTLQLAVQFLRPARPGRLIGRGRLVRRGSDVEFLAGELTDESGTVVATATATASFRSLPTS